MKILAVDTATQICSVALRETDGTIHEKTARGTGIHSEKLFLFINDLLDEIKAGIEDIDAVLIAGGPGSYTGLRIGASGVKGLLFNRDADLYSINTLAYFAHAAHRLNSQVRRIHGILDARRVHFYHQTFLVEEPILKPVGNVEIIPIDSMAEKLLEDDVIAGTGIGRLPETIVSNYNTCNESVITSSDLFHFWDLRNDYPASIVKKVAPDTFEPYYYSSMDMYNG